MALATVAAIGQGVALVIGFEHGSPWRPLLFPHCHRRAVCSNILGELFLISRVQKTSGWCPATMKARPTVVGDRNLSQGNDPGLGFGGSPMWPTLPPAEF